MPRRIEIELTSSRDDGSWTWRAAGAKEPRGTLPATLLPGESKVGDVLRVDAEFFVDGIEITGVLPPKGTRQEPERLELLVPVKEEPLVTTTLTTRAKDDRGPRREGGRREGARREGDGARRGAPVDGPQGPVRARGPTRAQRPASPADSSRAAPGSRRRAPEGEALAPRQGPSHGAARSAARGAAADRRAGRPGRAARRPPGHREAERGADRGRRSTDRGGTADGDGREARAEGARRGVAGSGGGRPARPGGASICATCVRSSRRRTPRPRTTRPARWRSSCAKGCRPGRRPSRRRGWPSSPPPSRSAGSSEHFA